MMKFITAARKAPQLIITGPMEKIAVCQAPPGTKGVIRGIIILSTNDFTSVVAAAPMINATARPVTLYSFRNSLNSVIILMSLLMIHYYLWFSDFNYSYFFLSCIFDFMQIILKK